MQPADCRYVAEGSGAARHLTMDQFALVQRGRSREFWRTVAVAVVLLVAQWPLREVTAGDWPSAFSFPAVVPGRLALVLDTMLVAAYLLVSFRAYGWVRSLRAARDMVVLSRVGMGLVITGAVIDQVVNVCLWVRLPGSGRTADLSIPGWSDAAVLLVLVGLLLQGVTLRSWYDARTKLQPTQPAPSPATTADTVISCSGGGIRSSAFSLGGLQALADAGVYHDASAVVGVSGGGYVAAAYHVVRWQPRDDPPVPPEAPTSEWPGLAGSPPFGEGTPEMSWVRRHTRYVMDSLRAAAEGALSLAFGIGVNLLLVAAAIGTTAWVLAWLLLASGRIQPWPPGDHQQLGAPRELPGIGGAFAPGWEPVAHVWWLPAAGLACFGLLKAWERLLPVPPKAADYLSQGSTWLLAGGGAATALLLGVPWVLSSLTAFAASSDSSLAALAHQLGLVPTQVCNDVLSTGASACGVTGTAELQPTSVVTVSAVSFATVVTSILAVLASAKSAGGPQAEAAGWVGRTLRAVWAKVKDPIVPWGAALLIVAVMLLVLLRWVAAYVEGSSLFLRWDYVYLTGALLLGTRVFTEPNRTSLHHFFRERISNAFLVRRSEGGVEPVPYRRPLRFSEAEPRDGGPALVACAVANVSDSELVPSRRGCTPFVFGHGRIGLTDPFLPSGAAQRHSASYEFAADSYYRDATVPAAVAISAAAFSPLAGRENVRLGPYRAVLALGNARLGVWLPNPLWLDEAVLVTRLLRLGRYDEAARIVAAMPGATCPGLGEKYQERLTTFLQLRATGVATAAGPSRRRSVLAWQALEFVRNVARKPGLTKLVKEGIGKASVYDRFLYVTDGGHYDNLGLIEALRRRPRRVFVLDASNDAENTFRALGRAIATARMDLGLEVEMDPRRMRTVIDGRSPAAWCAGTYRETTAPSGSVLGRVYLVKAIMLDGLPWDIETYSGENRVFPRTSTGRQLYSEFDFEAYRMLGQVTARAMLDATQGGTTLGVQPAAAPGPHPVGRPAESPAQPPGEPPADEEAA